jgi:PAS domain S-box-containing protein
MKSSVSEVLAMKPPSLHLKRSIAFFVLLWTAIIGMIILWDFNEAQNRILHVAVTLESIEESLEPLLRNILLKYSAIWLVGFLGACWVYWQMKRRNYFREKLERAVRENDSNLRQTLNSIGDGVISLDLGGKVTQLNRVAEKLSGRLNREVVGTPLADIIDLNIFQPSHQLSEAMPISSAALQGEGSKVKAFLKDSEGNDHLIYCELSSVTNAEGKPTGTLLVFHDLTDYKRFQEEVLNSRKLDSVSILAGGMAHDFNNLFTALFGNIQLALMKLDKEHPAHTYLLNATEVFERGHSLTNQLLTFTRGGLPILEETSLEAVLQQATQLIEESAISVEIKLPDDLSPVLGDQQQLIQVFVNLLTNSAEAMPKGGPLQISAENIKGDGLEGALVSGDHVKVLVRDEGRGIPEADREKVFDIFFTTKEQGRGLGLSIVHRIITKHDGFIQLNSETDLGTTFTIYLPASVDSAVSTALAPAEPTEHQGTVSSSILVVDDEKLIRDFLKELLEASGYQVDTSSNGEDAIVKYSTAMNNGNPYAVVITDLNMPGMSGDLVCKELLSRYPSARIIAASGYFNDNTMADYSSAGFKGRLSKPFDIETLQKELSRVMALE